MPTIELLKSRLDECYNIQECSIFSVKQHIDTRRSILSNCRNNKITPNKIYASNRICCPFSSLNFHLSLTLCIQDNDILCDIVLWLPEKCDAILPLGMKMIKTTDHLKINFLCDFMI